jgi:hypothetical protein
MDGIANSSNEAVIKLLDSYPDIASEVNLRSSSSHTNNTALILSLSKGWSHIDSSGESTIPHSVVIKKLIEKGANPNDQDADGRTPLHYACLHKDLRAIKFLIKNGALTNIKDINGQEPLNYIFYNYERALLILEKAATVFTIKKEYFTPNFNKSALILALQPLADVESILFKAYINKQLTEALLPIYHYFSHLAELNKINISIIIIHSDSTLESIHPNGSRGRAVRELFKIYMQLTNIASNIDYSSNNNFQNIMDALLTSLAKEQNNPLLSSNEHDLLGQIRNNLKLKSSFFPTMDQRSEQISCCSVS